MHGPLQGLLVIALEQAVAAPYCSSRLADAGARVIKIERPDGDFARGYDKAANGLSSYFVWLNRGKQSLVADIKDPDDAALLHRILARADVFIQNLAPGAAARTGLGSEELREHWPRLITVDISGYGDTGEYAAMKAYDLLVQAESGLAMITGHPGRPWARRRLGVRHRLWDGRSCRHIGGADRTRHHRPGQGVEGKPVRRDGGLDERPAAVFRGHRTRPRAAWLGPPVYLPLWRLRDRRWCVGADLHSERARVGRLLRGLSRRSRTCRNGTDFRPMSFASPIERRWMRISRRCSRVSPVARQPRSCARRTRPMVSSTTSRRSRVIRLCGAHGRNAEWPGFAGCTARSVQRRTSRARAGSRAWRTLGRSAPNSLSSA